MLNYFTSVSNAFNKAATTYDLYANTQAHTGNVLISRLPKQLYLTAIDLGCGVGKTTLDLQNTHSIHSLLAIDISATSLAIASKRLSNNVQIQQFNFDNDIPINTTFDLVFANMSLHWSQDLYLALLRYYSLLNVNGVFAFSIPLTGTFAELIPHFAINAFHSMTDVHHTLKKMQAEILYIDQEQLPLQFPDTLSALRYIKKIGATHTTTHLRHGLTGKQKLVTTDITSLTYQIGYFIIRKPSCVDSL